MLPFQPLLDHGAGQISDAELVKALAATRRHECYAHFSIALTKLADGDRTRARDHLRKAVATRFFYLLVYDLSQVLLDRLDHDEKWPPWPLPAR